MRQTKATLVAVLAISVAVGPPPWAKADIRASWYERYTLAVICHEQGRCLGGDAPDNVKAYLNPIFLRLIQATVMRSEQVGWFLTLERSPNAWALKHYIGITAGLLRARLTTDEMAFVLAHELGHVQFDHFDSKQREVAKYYQLARLETMLSHGQYNPLRDPYYVTAVRIVLASYSRAEESQADMQGLHTMERGGFDPRASITALLKIDPAGLARRGDIFDDHPTLLWRISALKKEIVRTTRP